MNLKLLLVHTRALTVELIRQPTYWIPTLLFPGMFFLFFASPNAKDTASANLLMASFCAFAVLGVVLMQFANGTAEERESPWFAYLRTLPVSSATLFGARIGTTILFGVLTAASTSLICLAASPVDLAGMAWLRLAFALVLGALPFSLLGLLIGNWFSAKAALPVTNMFYLPLSFAGGLWMPPNILPDAIQKISKYLPTRHYGELVWAATSGHDWTTENWVWLFGYSFVFMIALVWSRRLRRV